MLTRKQIEWAKQHDWFVNDLENTIEVSDCWADADGNYHEEYIVWNQSFQKLRDWAGY